MNFTWKGISSSWKNTALTALLFFMITKANSFHPISASRLRSLQGHGEFLESNAILYFSSSKSSAPLLLEEELGISRLFNNKYFDPLNLANDDNFPRLREAELKHGRVAMLATVGMIVPDVLRTPLMKGITMSWPWDKNVLNFGLENVPFSPFEKLSFGDIPSGLGALRVLPLWFWIVFIAGMGGLEVFVWKQRSPKALPGDYGTGFFGINDYGEHESFLEKELEFGRLAMVGFMLQVIFELTTHTTVGTPYRSWLFS